MLFQFVSCDLLPSTEDRQIDVLAETEWDLTTWTSADTSITQSDSLDNYDITFISEDSLRGAAICNSYVGSYKAFNGGRIQVNDLTIAIGQCISSSSNSAIQTHQQASEYIQVLDSVDNYEINNSRLRLEFGKNGNLVYKRSN